MYDAEETGKLLLDIFPRTKKNPDKFLGKGQPQGQPGQPPQPPMGAGQGSPPKPSSPISLKQPAGVGAGLTPMQGQ
jgi:hypothetical protein